MDHVHYKKLLLIFRGLFGFGFLALFVSLAWRDLVLSNALSVKHDFLSPSPFISDLVPYKRVEKGESLKITDQPVYTTLRYPRSFEKAAVSLTFRNPDGLTLQLGPQAAAGNIFALKDLDLPPLNAVFAKQDLWTASQENKEGLRLFQKRSSPYIFRSLEQFYAKLPPIQQIGYEGVAWPQPFLPKFAARAAAQETVIDVPLQGSHEFFVALNKPSLAFAVYAQDVNNRPGADGLVLTLKSWDGQDILSETLPDDGDESDNGPTSALRRLNLQADKLPVPAVYRISLQTSEDVYLQKITTTAPYLVVHQMLRLAGSKEYVSEFGASALRPVKLQTNSREWVAQAAEREWLQSVTVGNESLAVDLPLTPYTYRLAKSRSFSLEKGYEMITDKAGLQISGRGVFAFSPAQYFSPEPWLIDHTVDLDTLAVNYLLTDYQPPLFDPSLETKTQTIKIDPSKIFTAERSLRLQLASPDLQPGQSVEVLGMKVDYQMKPLRLAEWFERGLTYLKQRF